jgi:predicted ATPase
MITSLKFIKDYRTFKEGQELLFKKGVNLLCGDQGIGKTSLLNLINNKKERDRFAECVLERGKLFYFDFEKDNPRMKNFVTESKGIADAMITMNSKFQSHGETVLGVLRNSTSELKNTYVILDEPDQGLSITSCLELVGILNTLAENECQVIATIHNPIIIQAFEVFNLHTFKWEEGKEFVNFMIRSFQEEATECDP